MPECSRSLGILRCERQCRFHTLFKHPLPFDQIGLASNIDNPAESSQRRASAIEANGLGADFFRNELVQFEASLVEFWVRDMEGILPRGGGIGRGSWI